jgi:hypothetical protein
MASPSAIATLSRNISSLGGCRYTNFIHIRLSGHELTGDFLIVSKDQLRVIDHLVDGILLIARKV